MPCQFGDSPMSLDKKNYITGNQKRQALFLNFLNFFIYIYKTPNSTVCREAFMAKHREFWKNKDPQLSMSDVSLPPLPSDGGIWCFVDINKKV